MMHLTSRLPLSVIVSAVATCGDDAAKTGEDLPRSGSLCTAFVLFQEAKTRCSNEETGSIVAWSMWHPATDGMMYSSESRGMELGILSLNQLGH